MSLLLSLISVTPLPGSSAFGQAVEETVVSAMFGVATGFVTGELGWVAAPKVADTNLKSPYYLDTVNQYKFPAAVGSAYGLGLPFGAALGLHLAEGGFGEHTSLWSKWLGAEAGTLLTSGLSYLLLRLDGDRTDSSAGVIDRGIYADTPLEKIASLLPLAGAIGGAFAGRAIAPRLGLSQTSPPPFEVGLSTAKNHLALACALRIRF
jgi:hypothetical protein